MTASASTKTILSLREKLLKENVQEPETTNMSDREVCNMSGGATETFFGCSPVWWWRWPPPAVWGGGSFGLWQVLGRCRHKLAEPPLKTTRGRTLSMQSLQETPAWAYPAPHTHTESLSSLSLSLLLALVCDWTFPRPWVQVIQYNRTEKTQWEKIYILKKLINHLFHFFSKKQKYVLVWPFWMLRFLCCKSF